MLIVNDQLRIERLRAAKALADEKFDRDREREKYLPAYRSANERAISIQKRKQN